nr:arabinosyltransferase domain-containing protein [Kineococcus aurantiacus]
MAPVVVDTPAVSWPATTGGASTSTAALFMPYRPLDVRVQAPCATAAALDARTAAGQRSTLVATAPGGSERGAQRSLAVTVGDGRVVVRSDGTDLLDEPLTDVLTTALTTGDAGCALVVEATQDGTRVSADGRVLAERAGARVPEVTAFVTDATAADGAGPAALAHPDARFQSRPAALKVAVLLAHGLLALGSLVVLLALAGPLRRRERGGRPAALDPAAPRGRRTLAAWACDVVVAGGLVLWAGVGPLHTDDWYYVVEARSAAAQGFIGNVVRYFDVAEIPFTLQQQLLALVVPFTVSPWAMRLPAAVFGVLTWFLLTRFLLPRLVERPPVWTRPVAAVVLLAWWLPFDVSARPESFVVALSTATLVLVLEAVARRRVWLLGLAAVCAGAAVAVTASGVLAAGLALALAPRWWPLLRDSRLGAVATGALVLACASVASPLVFADATLAGALTALRVHDEVGPNLEWWQESSRYTYLVDGPDPNQELYSRQVAVLLTLLVLVGVTTTLLRARRAARVDWVVPVTGVVVGLGSLFLSPTKWTHHFGALAGVGTLLVVVGAVVLVRRRPTRWALVALWGAVAVVVAMAFHGPDAQVEYSAYGVDPELPAVLGNPATWLVLSALAAVPLWWRARRRERRDAWPELVATSLVVSLLASVLVQVGSVARAAHRLRGSWSVAQAALAPTPCGFADAAVALTGAAALTAADGPAPQRAADPVSGAGSTAGAPAGAGSWTGTGEVRTPWRALGERTGDDTIALDVSGGPAAVTVEFLTGAGAVLPVPAVVPGGTGWRRVGFGPVAATPAGAVAVRVVLDAGPGAQGEAAVTDVYRRTAQVVSDVVPAGSTVLLDWPLGLHFPCYAPPRVADGLVEPVRWFVRSATFESTDPLTFIDGGGSYATLREVATLTPYRGYLPGTDYREWGDLVRVDYDLPLDGYAVTGGTRTVPGWRWWPGAGPGPSPDWVRE